MRTLGLDISTVATGWVVLDDGKLKAKGIINPVNDLKADGVFKTKKEASEYLKSELRKFRYISGRIATVIAEFDPDVVTVERAYLGSTTRKKKLPNGQWTTEKGTWNPNALQIMTLLAGGALYFWMFAKALPGSGKRTYFVGASTARAAVGCKGNAKKADVIKFVNETFDMDITDDNEADAFVLAYYGYQAAKGESHA